MTVDEVMSERAELLGKKFGVGLSQVEAERLEFLNGEASRLLPRVSKERLRSMQETVRKAEKLARE
jgi:hypothetical protein